MSAGDGFIVQFRMASGCVGTMQSTCADRSPPMIETRAVGGGEVLGGAVTQTFAITSSA
jgi:hypothetical protein